MPDTLSLPPFHLAFPVLDIAATRDFYVEVLGCRVGRQAERWIDFDLCGHQLSAHLIDHPEPGSPTNQVDGRAVPVRHFGLVLPWADWQRLRKRLQAAGTKFLIEPHIRFAGELGEQATLFLLDPAGNGLEFKSFRDPAQLFACAPAPAR